MELLQMTSTLIAGGKIENTLAKLTASTQGKVATGAPTEMTVLTLVRGEKAELKTIPVSESEMEASLTYDWPN